MSKTARINKPFMSERKLENQIISQTVRKFKPHGLESNKIENKI